MNNNFDMGIVGALELSDEELMMIQGGGFFSDAWNWTKKAASDAWHAVSSSTGQKVVKTVGGIVGTIAGIIALF